MVCAMGKKRKERGQKMKRILVIMLIIIITLLSGCTEAEKDNSSDVHIVYVPNPNGTMQMYPVID